MRFRTIWISDTHLGTRACQADLLLDFLKKTECEKLYLVGDIIDGWRLKRTWYWPQANNDVVQKILRKARKGVDAFAALDLPGSKVVIGDGPALPALRGAHPGIHWLGALHGPELARHIGEADVFVFPSRTDTFGLVMLEALACGVPVAAHPVSGPVDVIGPDGQGAPPDPEAGS